MEGAVNILSVKQTNLPDKSLLKTYAHIKGCHTDCFSTEIQKHIDLQQYIAGFLTSPIFKIERWILSVALQKLSTDQEASLLAENKVDQFSAWGVEARNDNQLLMADYSNKTRFWIMIEKSVEKETTKLHFGSAVLPNKEGVMPKAIWFRVLMKLHKLYSIILLWSAKSKLMAKIN